MRLLGAQNVEDLGPHHVRELKALHKNMTLTDEYR